MSGGPQQFAKPHRTRLQALKPQMGRRISFRLTARGTHMYL